MKDVHAINRIHFAKRDLDHVGHRYHSWQDHNPSLKQINQFKSRYHLFLPIPWISLLSLQHRSYSNTKKWKYERKKGMAWWSIRIWGDRQEWNMRCWPKVGKDKRRQNYKSDVIWAVVDGGELEIKEYLSNNYSQNARGGLEKNRILFCPMSPHPQRLPVLQW